jgi:carboxyl-terminal processing protease
MKTNKGLILIVVLLSGVLFVAFTNNYKTDKVISQKQKLLAKVGELLETQHYSPKDINDAFSKKIFAKFINELDGDKCLFTETDIDALKKYETTLDDEIHGKDEFQFLPAINAVYNKRTDEIILLYKEILKNPFDFSVDEDYTIDGERVPFPKNDADRKDRLRKKLKYMALERYVDLLDQKEKSVVDSIKNKPNAQLEIDARTRVQKALDKIYGRIKAKFNDDERFNAYVNVITNQMDPHSDYFPPVEKRAFDEMMSGRFFGIGAQLQEQDGNIKISSLIPAYPAQRSGEIDVNDIIVKVAQGNEEPVEITGYDIQDAVKLIRGKRDTEVKLTIKKVDGTTKVVSIIRAEIVQDESYARSAVYTDANGDKIGYLYLPDFYADFERANGARCSEDVAVEIKKLKAANVKGIVLDLRYNGGGSLYEVVQMVGLFVPQGPVVLVRDKDGKSTPLPSDSRGGNNAVLYDGPLTVMVNEASASASEIFAAAIQDYGRGIIVGSSTYGKGTVQRNVPLSRQIDFMNNAQPDLGFVKLTFQKFYRISGGSTQLKGVTPDVVVPDMLDYLKIREKDNTASLAWDEIKKVNYQTYKTADVNSQVISKVNNEISNNTSFKLIKDNTSWLSKHSEEPRTLKLDKFKEYQKSVASTAAQTLSLIKLKQELEISVLKEDYDKFYNNADKQKGERYQAWLKGIKSDLYISESFDIIRSMITANAFAAKN